MDFDFIYAEARANGSSDKEALRVCVLVNREVAAERERCAKECERQDWPGDSETDYLAGVEFAARIRRA